MSGWVKLHRKIQKWGWRKSPYHTSVLLDLLLEANHADGEFLGVYIPKGSLTTSVKAISERTGVSQKRVRTILNHLKQTNEVAIKTTSKFSMISISKWEEYQLSGDQLGNQGASEGQTKGKQGATNKNANNVKNEENSFAPVLTMGAISTPDQLLQYWNDNFLPKGYPSAPFTFGATKIQEFFNINKRLIENKTSWLEYLNRVNASEFLTLKKRGGKPAITWLLNESNFDEVMSGKYDPDRSEDQEEARVQAAREFYKSKFGHYPDEPDLMTGDPA